MNLKQNFLNRINNWRTLIVLAILFFAVQSNAKFIPPALTLTPQDQANSDQFKALSGQDRLAVFNLLKPLIVAESSGVYLTPGTLGALTTEAEVITLLGTPDFTLTTNVFGYYLKGSTNSCTVVFGKTGGNTIQYFSINDCN